MFRNADDIDGLNLTNGAKGIDPIDAIGDRSVRAARDARRNLGAFDNAYKFIVYGLLLALRHLRLAADPRRPAGTGLAGHPGGRARGQHDGRAADADEAGRLRGGRGLGGMGGVAYATLTGGVIPDRFQFSNSIILLAMVVLGGMGNVWGVLLGALVLEWINAVGLPQFGTSFNSTFGTDIDFPSYNFLIFGLLLMLMMLFRREGLLPETRTRQVLQAAGTRGARIRRRRPRGDPGMSAITEEAAPPLSMHADGITSVSEA